MGCFHSIRMGVFSIPSWCSGNKYRLSLNFSHASSWIAFQSIPGWQILWEQRQTSWLLNKTSQFSVICTGLPSQISLSMLYPSLATVRKWNVEFFQAAFQTHYSFPQLWTTLGWYECHFPHNLQWSGLRNCKENSESGILKAHAVMDYCVW